jgi:hypothetical protein
MPSTLFFPLRTNIGYFRSDIAYLDLRARVKQALILFDQILFEANIYQSIIGTNTFISSFETTIQYFQNYPLEFSNPDKGFLGFYMEVIDPYAGPEAPHIIMKPPWEHHFTSQFHTLYDEISSVGIKEVSIQEFKLESEYNNLVKRLASIDEDTIAFEDQRIRELIIQNLNHDLVLASLLGVPMSVDGLHAPILEQKSRQLPGVVSASGFQPLTVFVPYIGDLEWEQIVEIRQQPSIKEFRKKMSEIELMINSLIGEASWDEIREQLLYILSDELLREIASLRPRGEDIIQGVTLELVGNIIPPIGITKSIIEKSIDIKNWFEGRRSWIATLMKLRSYNDEP